MCRPKVMTRTYRLCFLTLSEFNLKRIYTSTHSPVTAHCRSIMCVISLHVCLIACMHLRAVSHAEMYNVSTLLRMCLFVGYVCVRLFLLDKGLPGCHGD